MDNTFDTLIKVLKTDPRFFSEDNILLRNKVVEAANVNDEALLKLLLSDKTLKEQFFADINSILVFNQSKFGYVVNNRQFLPNSYTRFKNKIGLTDDRGDLLVSQNNVELVFPYKDCILEGGQTKDDQNRDEVFYNETLAPEQVDRLLYPKVLVGAKRYSKDGVVTATQFRDTDNLIIKGNNLLAISSLLKRFEGRIKCIYIDPPFNTGKGDGFNYNDKFTRSTWLVFMRNRLELARRLLTPDGNIFMHIDINQSHYLKVMADEIFKEENFVEEIIWAYGSPSGGRATTPKPVNIHDYILHYAANYSERKQNRVYIPYSEKYITDWFKYKDDDGRLYRRRQRGYDENGDTVWEKQYLDESKGIPLSTVWNDIKQVYADPRAYKSGMKADVEVIKAFKGGQKPEALIQRIFEMSTNAGDLVLDFCGGTGTTLATAHKMGLRYVGVEQMDYIETLIVPRLQKVIHGETAGITKIVNWQGGGSFVYCELAKCNQKFVEAIESTDSDEELIKLLDIILKSGFISCKVNPSEIVANATEFAELSTSDKKKFLMLLLDKNMLYVNLCDIDDEDYEISDNDKAFTKSFYEEK